MIRRVKFSFNKIKFVYKINQVAKAHTLHQPNYLLPHEFNCAYLNSIPHSGSMVINFRLKVLRLIIGFDLDLINLYYGQVAMVDSLNLMANEFIRSVGEFLAINVDFSCFFILKSYVLMIRGDFLMMVSGFVLTPPIPHYH